MLSEVDLRQVVTICSSPSADTPEHVAQAFAPATTDPVEYVQEAVRRLEVGPPKVRAPGISYATLASVFTTSLDFDGEVRHVLRSGGVPALLDAGATVIVNRFDRAESRLSEMVGQVREKRLADVCANAYLSRSGSGTFGWHFDDHDVVVMQLAGSKRWELAGREMTQPIQGDVGVGRTKPVRAESAVQLHPGDVLRVPRGVWHSVETRAGQPSLHLSIALFPLTIERVVVAAAKRIMLRSEEDRVDLAPLVDSERRDAIQHSLERIADVLMVKPLRSQDAEENDVDSLSFDEPV